MCRVIWQRFTDDAMRVIASCVSRSTCGEAPLGGVTGEHSQGMLWVG